MCIWTSPAWNLHDIQKDNLLLAKYSHAPQSSLLCQGFEGKSRGCCAQGLRAGSKTLGLSRCCHRWAHDRRDIHCLGTQSSCFLKQTPLFTPPRHILLIFPRNEAKAMYKWCFLCLSKSFAVSLQYHESVPSSPAPSQLAEPSLLSYQCRKITASVLLCP